MNIFIVSKVHSTLKYKTTKVHSAFNSAIQIHLIEQSNITLFNIINNGLIQFKDLIVSRWTIFAYESEIASCQEKKFYPFCN